MSSVHGSRLVGGQPLTFKLPLEEGWEANLSTNAAQIKINFRYPAIRQIENDFWVLRAARTSLLVGGRRSWHRCGTIRAVVPEIEDDFRAGNKFSTISGGDALVDEAVCPVVPEVEPELELEASVGMLPDRLAARRRACFSILTTFRTAF